MTAMLTSGFRTPIRPLHNGIDVTGPMGSQIYANKQMTVVGAYSGSGDGGGYGRHIITRDSQGNKYVYAHLDSIPEKLSEGSVIPPGGLIAYMGNTGTVRPGPTASNPTAGTHLHYEVYERQGNRDVLVDPLTSIDITTSRPYVNNSSFTANSNPLASSLLSSTATAPAGYKQKSLPTASSQNQNQPQERPQGRPQPIPPAPLATRQTLNSLFEQRINPVLKLGDK